MSAEREADFVKLEIVARTDTGLPIRYPHLDEDD